VIRGVLNFSNVLPPPTSPTIKLIKREELKGENIGLKWMEGGGAERGYVVLKDRMGMMGQILIGMAPTSAKDGS